MPKIKGKALQLRVNEKTIALSTNCQLSTTTQIIDSKTKDDAAGPAGDFDYVDWTVSSENILGYNEGVTAEQTYGQLLELQLAGTVVNISLDLIANASGKIPQTGWQTADSDTVYPYYIAVGGDALIESVNLNAPGEGNATVSVNFKAVGPLAPIPVQS